MIKNIKAITTSAYLSMFFLGVSASLVGAAAQNIGLSAFQIGLLIAVQNVGFIIAVLVSGALADDYEKPKILFGGSVILGIAYLTFYMSNIFWLNLLIMLFIGAGIGTYEGVTDAMLLEIHTRRQSLHINVNHFFVTFGSIMIAVYLTFTIVNWRSSIIQVGVVVLLLALFFAFIKLQNHHKHAESYLNRLKILTKERTVIVLFLLTMLVVGVEAGSIGILSTFLADMRGFSSYASNIGLIVFLIGIAVGRLLVGFLSNDKQVGQITLGLLGVSFLIFMALFLIDFGSLSYGAIFVAGLSMSALVPLIITMAGLLYPDIAGTVLGAVKVAMPVGGILTPFLMSIVAQQISLQVALLLFPLSFLIGFLILYVGLRRLKSMATPSLAKT